MCEAIDDLARPAFDQAVKARLAERGVFWNDAAVHACVSDSLVDAGVVFGDPSWDWCAAAAVLFVDEALLDE